MDKMREEFEDWYRNYMLNDEREHFAVIDSTIDSYKHDRDKYGYSDIQEMWLSWKASRAALCVELPKPKECDGAMVLIFDVDESLDEAGVPHK